LRFEEEGRRREEGRREVKILLVNPGASWSTKDVYDNLLSGMRKSGVFPFQYNLDVRLARSAYWLKWNWKKSGKKGECPSFADASYHASTGVLERALRQNVDWVVVVSAMFLHPDVFILMKRAGLKVAVVMTESPYDDKPQMDVAKLVDLVWTNERSSVDVLKAAQPNTYYLAHAFSPEQHRPDLALEPDVPRHDVVFVGTGFRERVELLKALPWSDGSVDFGLYGTWSALPARSWLRKTCLKGSVVDNRVAAQLYRAAKIGLNWHRTSIGFGVKGNHPQILGADSLNPRCYELAACQSFFVTDWRAELDDVFGDLVPTYRSADELDDLVRRWLPDDEGRRVRAAAIRDAVRPHTWDVRAEQVLNQLSGWKAAA
jgi:spore maturation protein CgeB